VAGGGDPPVNGGKCAWSGWEGSPSGSSSCGEEAVVLTTVSRDGARLPIRPACATKHTGPYHSGSAGLRPASVFVENAR
jgi:hypothetical protein